jgi:hypothetical protein
MGRRIHFVVALCCVLVVVAFATAAGAVSRPDPRLTPGAADARLVSVQAGNQCPGTVLSKHLSQKLQHQVFAAYRVQNHKRSAYLIDRLVPTRLGGTNARSNLWPLRRSGVQRKRAVETEVTGLVCSGALDLATAQDLFRHDWVNAATLARQAVEQRTASLVAYLAGVEQAERERLLAEYLASLPPPEPPPEPVPTPTTIMPRPRVSIPTRSIPEAPPSDPCSGPILRDPNDPTASPPLCPSS